MKLTKETQEALETAKINIKMNEITNYIAKKQADDEAMKEIKKSKGQQNK
ncbi:hypothetical protein WMB10_01805 [Tetragenococcus halophilus]